MLAFYVAILDTEEQKDKFTEIYTTYYGMMYQVARAITHDDKLAEDALHETCLELIEKIDSIRTDNESHHRLHAQVGSPKCVIL